MDVQIMCILMYVQLCAKVWATLLKNILQRIYVSAVSVYFPENLTSDGTFIFYILGSNMYISANK